MLKKATLRYITEREWYARRAVEHGCSRAVLEMWIDTSVYHRQGKAPDNFKKVLPAPYSDLAEQAVKDPYCFDFLTIIDEAREKEIEANLMDHLQKFLLELGSGFAFVGRQVPTRVGYEFRSHWSTPERLYFKLDLPDPEEGTRRYHLHPMSIETKDLKEMLGFRDYLRSHPNEVQEYAELKQMAAQEVNEDGAKYRELKGPIFKKILNKIFS